MRDVEAGTRSRMRGNGGILPRQLLSKYGNRFLTGLKYNSAGIPVIITNGLGTSRKDVRLFTPSEVVLVVLHKKK